MQIERYKTWFKVLRNGRSFHGGSLAWSLPTKGADETWTHGEWHEVPGNAMCEPGTLHVTNDPVSWYAPDATVYVAECEGQVGTLEDKGGFRRVRLLREVTADELPTLGIVIAGNHKATGKIWVANATVRAWGNATVRASDNATVEASDNATVEASDNATVEASGNATVEASDNATVEASGNATVNLLWGVPVIKEQEGYAVVIDRRQSPPVVTCAWQEKATEPTVDAA